MAYPGSAPAHPTIWTSHDPPRCFQHTAIPAPSRRRAHPMINRSEAVTARLADAGHPTPDEIGSAGELIATAYTYDVDQQPADHVVQAMALACVARTVVAHAAAHGTVLRPTAPELPVLAVAVWLPAEAPPLPQLDDDLIAACGPYSRQLFAHAAMLRAQNGDERYDMLWFTAVHPTMQRRHVAGSLLQHRRRVLASQNRRTFALAPTVHARTLLSTVGFRDHHSAIGLGPAEAPPFPMRWGHRPAWTDLINSASRATARVAGARR